MTTSGGERRVALWGVVAMVAILAVAIGMVVARRERALRGPSVPPETALVAGPDGRLSLPPALLLEHERWVVLRLQGTGSCRGTYGGQDAEYDGASDLGPESHGEATFQFPAQGRVWYRLSGSDTLKVETWVDGRLVDSRSTGRGPGELSLEFETTP